VSVYVCVCVCVRAPVREGWTDNIYIYIIYRIIYIYIYILCCSVPQEPAGPCFYARPTMLPFALAPHSLTHSLTHSPSLPPSLPLSTYTRSHLNRVDSQWQKLDTENKKQLNSFLVEHLKSVPVVKLSKSCRYD
jgi:hypothetical protein